MKNKGTDNKDIKEFKDYIHRKIDKIYSAEKSIK